MAPLTLTLPARMEAVKTLLDSIEAYCAREAVPDAARYDLMLSLEELFTNVVKYAWPEGTPAGAPVEITVTTTVAGELEATVIDAGNPFDPWNDAPPVELDLPAEDRPIGGLGLHLVRSVMDAVAYERRGDRNVATVRRNPHRGG